MGSHLDHVVLYENNECAKATSCACALPDIRTIQPKHNKKFIGVRVTEFSCALTPSRQRVRSKRRQDMSEHTNYCTGKGLFPAIVIIAGMMLGVPYLLTLGM
jgi:hypothetical protein